MSNRETGSLPLEKLTWERRTCKSHAKCAFLKKNWHILSKDGLKPDPEKCKAVKKYPTPKNVEEVRRFVAFSNYYRNFITYFVTLEIPVNNLLKKKVPLNFNEDCRISFKKLKEILTSPKILRFSNFNEEFILRTDASAFALGATISNANGNPVAYACTTFNKAKRNYSAIEK